MRIAIVTAIHGKLPALEAVVRDIGWRGVDAVVNLGDSLPGPLLPLQTARFLMAQDWTHRDGNQERQVLNLDPLRADPKDACTRSEFGSGELAWPARLGLPARVRPLAGGARLSRSGPAPAAWRRGRARTIR